jgi:colanic acid biosynthesis glycosyl transferase WcaI
MFAGTLGLASRADILVEVARAFGPADQIRVVCIGEGILKKEMERAAASDGLPRLLLLPFQPRHRVAEVQSSADVMLLTSSPEMGTSSIPSKLITYLAVGKPVICSVTADADIAHLVTGHQIAVVELQPGQLPPRFERCEQKICVWRHVTPGAPASSTASCLAAMERFDDVLNTHGQDVRASGRLERLTCWDGQC